MAADLSKPSANRVTQAVAGVIPPQVAEGRIREVFPTVLGVMPAAATLAKRLMRSGILLPVGWLILAPVFALKFAPFVSKRYTLTNRRLAIRKGWKRTVVQEVALADIDDVRFDAAQVDAFYLSGPLEVVSKGQVVMTLPGVPEPEGFRHAIINAVKAWVPGKATGPWQPASAE